MEPFNSDAVQWSVEAQQKLQQIPFFARAQARRQIERLALEQDIEVITLALLEQARRELGQ
ncbi:MAG: PCP reductase family protein [Cyanobacteria bacterium P01_A01_bin.135]